jgi:nitrogen regulatory protein PII
MMFTVARPVGNVKPPMLQVIALVKPFRAEAVLHALAASDAEAVAVREVKGFGRQKERLSLYLGSEYSDAFLPKVEVSAFFGTREQAEAAIKAIIATARTGRMGDGKLFLLTGQDIDVGW